MKLCKCHGVPMISTGVGLTCRIKRRISMARANAKYDKTPKGKVNTKNSNDKRIHAGQNVLGYAATAELAKQINDHIRRRLRERRKAV